MSNNLFGRIFGESIEASELASLLYSECVLAEEKPVMTNRFGSYKNQNGFQRDVLERKVFLYLVANIAIALTNASKKNPNVLAAIARFKTLVSSEMNSRWGYTQEMVDHAVDQAATTYAKLLYTKPDDNRALSFEWSQEWLKDIGIDEFNPATLFEISYGWKLDNVYLARFLSKIRVAKG